MIYTVYTCRLSGGWSFVERTLVFREIRRERVLHPRSEPTKAQGARPSRIWSRGLLVARRSLSNCFSLALNLTTDYNSFRLQETVCALFLSRPPTAAGSAYLNLPWQRPDIVVSTTDALILGIIRADTGSSISHATISTTAREAYTRLSEPVLHTILCT